jgi:spore germination cell wall hydrolase CwlJ-like protein
MVFSPQPAAPLSPARAVRRTHPIAKLLAVGVFCALTYTGLTAGAFGPATGLAEVLPPQVNLVQASLSYTGVDPVITGSVDHLFKSASFSGPNRSEKGDRIRPKVDALALSKSFEEVRVRLASLRSDPADMGQSRFAALDIAPTGDVEIGPRMSVASLGGSGASALDAIADIAPEMKTPMPVAASEQLAYARAQAPITGGFAAGQPIEIDDKELWCLATAIYFEARGESYRGQVAIAQVVQNRVKDRRYPKTICGVVFQNQNRRNSCQFSFACDGMPEVINDKSSWAQAQDIARRFADGELYLTEVGKATHYHATYVRPAWAPRMVKLTQIGLHVFYEFKRGWLFG